MLARAVARALETERDERRRCVLRCWARGQVPLLEHRDDRAQEKLIVALMLEAHTDGKPFVLMIDDVMGIRCARAIVQESLEVAFPGAQLQQIRHGYRLGELVVLYGYTSDEASWYYDLLICTGGMPTPFHLKHLLRRGKPHVQTVLSNFEPPPKMTGAWSDGSDSEDI